VNSHKTPSNQRPEGLPDGVEPYRQSPVFTQDSVPDAFLQEHNTKDGVWAVIHVDSGKLFFEVPSTGTEKTLEAGDITVAEPVVPHRVEPIGAVSFWVEFWR